MDALSSSPVDVLGANPVVLVSIKDIAHLVGANSVHVLVVPADLFPLQEKLKGMFTQRIFIYIYLYIHIYILEFIPILFTSGVSITSKALLSMTACVSLFPFER